MSTWISCLFQETLLGKNKAINQLKIQREWKEGKEGGERRGDERRGEERRGRKRNFAVCFRKFPHINYEGHEPTHLCKHLIITPSLFIKACFNIFTSQGPPILNYYITNVVQCKTIHLERPTSNHLSSDPKDIKLYHSGFLLVRRC